MCSEGGGPPSRPSHRPGRFVHSHRPARRVALDLLYEADIRGEDAARILAQRIDADADVPPYARELVEGVARELDTLDRLIGRHSEGWAVSRMPAVDRTILRLACYEMLHRDDVPVAAAISEAVEAAKQLSTGDSGRFVNGVLGNIAREQADAGGKPSP